MIQINKTSAPRSFITDLASGAKIYPDDLSRKGWSDLRISLLEDQGFICCYCQRRIPHNNTKNIIVKPKSKIEHFKCQDDNQDLQLVYENMFIACNGNIATTNLTCDSKKDNSVLTKVNFSTTIEKVIYYTKNGQIKSNDSDLQKEIDEILNLNDENLMKYRQSIYNVIERSKKTMGKLRGNYQHHLKREIKRWESKDNLGKFREYKGVGLYFLHK